MASETRKTQPKAEQPGEQPLHGVVIAIDPEAKAKGELKLHIAAQGGVSLIELPGLLLVAKRQVEEKLGA